MEVQTEKGDEGLSEMGEKLSFPFCLEINVYGNFLRDSVSMFVLYISLNMHNELYFKIYNSKDLVNTATCFMFNGPAVFFQL